MCLVGKSRLPLFGRIGDWQRLVMSGEIGRVGRVGMVGLSFLLGRRMGVFRSPDISFEKKYGRKDEKGRTLSGSFIGEI